MLHYDIIAAGRLRQGAYYDLWREYTRRLTAPLTLHEIQTADAAVEQAKIQEKIDGQAFVFALDEKGKSLKSAAFSERLEKIAADGARKVQFIIGGADGLNAEIRGRANFLLSFGIQTWPHMMVRVMLAEQLYRAQQITARHPYHRE